MDVSAIQMKYYYYYYLLLSLPSDFRVAYAANISEHLTIR